MYMKLITKKIFVTTSSSIIDYKTFIRDNAKDGNNYELKYNKLKRKMNSEEIIENCFNCEGIIAGTELYDKNVLNELKKLKVISRVGVGLDNIDLDYALQKNIKIFKTDINLAPAVAELALGLMLNVARNISKHDQNLKNGYWKKEMGSLLTGKTLGIIGLGAIGKELIKLTRGFKFKVLAYDKFQDQVFAKKYQINYCDLDSLMSSADIISVHLSLSEDTRMFIDKSYIDKMKNNAIIINTSRGEIIDDAALYNALNDGQILGAGLDVFNEEPYEGPIKKLNNAVITPHIASYAKEIRVEMETEAANNLLKGLRNVTE